MPNRRILTYAVGAAVSGLLLGVFQMASFTTPAEPGKADQAKPPKREPSVQPLTIPVVAAPAIPSASMEKGDPIVAFDLWLRRWQAAQPTDRSTLIEEGAQLAEQRQAALYQLIAKEPEAALKAAISPAVRRFLPKAVKPWIEQRIHQRGDLAVVGVTPLRGMEHLVPRPVFREARFEGRTLDAYVYGRRAQQDTKYGSSLLGIAVKDRIAVLDEPAMVIPASDVPETETIANGVALGEHTAPAMGSRNKPVLAVQGKYYPVCCAAHAAMLAQQAVAAESKPGPFVEAAGGGQTAAAPAPAPLTTQGALDVLVIVADFADAPGRPTDVSSNSSATSTYITNRLTTEISDFYTQASYGKTSIGSVTVTDVLRLSGNLATYATTNNAAGLQAAALSAATANGKVISNYDRVAVVFARTGSIPGNQFTWAGLGDIGGTFTWFNGNFSLYVVSHELGHNYGLRHANLWEVTDGNPVSATGTSHEYGDIYDIMGTGPGDAVNQTSFPNPWFMNRIHWLPDAAVQTISSSGTYRVLRFDHQNASLSSTLALKVARDSNTDYWIGYRRKYVGTPLSDVSDGAYFVWGYQNDARSNLIDLNTPGTSASDASLKVGSTFNDTEAGVDFTVAAAGGSGTGEYLDIQVNFQPRLVFQKKAYSVDEQAGSVVITVERRNKSSGIVSAQYSTVNGTATAGSDFTLTAGTLTWPDGDSTPRTITIPIAADATTEGAETFTLALSSVVGGVTPGGASVGITIQEAGAEDLTFAPPAFNSAVGRLIVQPDSKAVVVGNFDAEDPITSAGIIRMDESGAQDTSFNQGPGGSPEITEVGRLQFNAIARQSDGKLLVGGAFTSLRSVNRNRIARLNVDGTLDNSFDAGTGPNADVKCIVVQPDGRILVGGEFTTWNGGARKALARLNEDGTLDATLANLDTVVDFFSGFEAVNAIALQPSTTAPFYRILAGGDFYRPSTGSGFHFGIVALNPLNGARDTAFDVTYGAHTAGKNGEGNPVSSILVQPDGKVVVGGQFGGFNNVTCGHFIRLNSNGTYDTTFKTNAGAGLIGSGFADVSDIVMQGDGRLIFAGHFATASGVSQPCIARYLGTGAFDSTFRASVPLSGSIVGAYALAMQPDGKVILGINGAGAGNVVKRFFTAQPQLPSVIGFTSTTATALEGPGTSIVVERLGGSLGEVKVFYSTVNRTAEAGTDYTAAEGVLTWASGDSTPKTISINVADDGVVESDELFEVRLAHPLGGALLGEKQIASVLITSGDLSGVPHVSFAATTSTPGEGAGTATVTVNVSPATTTPFTLPFTITGTATAGTGKDYTMATTSPLSFVAGETSKTITLNLLQDGLLDPAETIIFSLGSPSGYAVRGTDIVHTLTIVDDEALPTITSSPGHRFVGVGETTVFTTTSSGNPAPTSYIWKKGTAVIAGQSAANYTITNVQTTHGGAFNVSAKSLLSTSLPSSSAELAVADLRPRRLFYYKGNNITLTIPCSANVTGFRWFNGVTEVVNDPGHIAGQGTKTLTITSARTTDHGDYTCVLTSPAAGLSRTTGAIKVHVIEFAPQFIDPISFPPAVVGGAFSFNIADHINTADEVTPVSFSAGVLPTGLTINTATGVISGVPNVALTAGTSRIYPVTIKAINAKTPVPSRTINLTLSALPLGSVGTFAAFVPRDPGLNENLGDRITLITATGGTFTGTLVDGALARSFSGKLTTTPGSNLVTGVATIVRVAKPTNLPTLTLTFTIDSQANLVSGSLTNGTHTQNFSGWRSVVPTLAYQKMYNFGMTLASANSALPAGTGFGTFNVATTGLLTITGKLSDGVAFSTSTFVGPSGEVLLHYATSTTDTILGKLDIEPGTALDFSDYHLTGTATWSRKPQADTVRLYRDTFGPVDVNVVGGRYVAPVSPQVFYAMPYIAGVTLSNGALVFTDADFGSAVPPVTPDVSVLVKPGGIATVVSPNPRPRSTTFAVKVTTGGFSGLFTLLDPNPLVPTTNISRPSIAYQGLVYRNGSSLNAQGYFLLNNLPRVVNETSLNTKTVSGKVVLNVVP